MKKNMKIVLRPNNSSFCEAFEVKKIINSADFAIGELIDREYVDDLINTKNWTVEIVEK
jgi:hypothetical protein